MKEEQKEAQPIEQVTTPEPVSEIPEKEVTPEPKQPTEGEPEQPRTQISSETPEAETKTVQEELAELVKGCVVEGECKSLGSKFGEAAERLGMPVDSLIDAVFELVKKAK